MKVILLQDIKGTGKKGEIINTSDGHARNYLFPRNMAKEASESNLRELDHQKASMDKRKQQELEAAQELGKQLEAITLTIKSKAGEGGKLFGAITSKEVVDILDKKHGFKVDKKKVTLEAIKSLGSTKADIKLHQKVTASVKINVEAE